MFYGGNMVTVNGEKKDLGGKNVAEMLEIMGFVGARVAVEINGELIPRARRADTLLRDGDSVEVVSFVGGG